MLYYLIALEIGIIFGTITGITPGIHINLISVFLITLSTTILSKINPLILVVFIVAMSITHTFIDFIPSIFLGCPDTDTELSILPGHELLKQGQGYQAILLTAYGSLAAIFLLIFITPFSIWLIPKIYYKLNFLIPYFLILVSIFLISSEKNKISALTVFILSGLLGWSVLNLDLKEPLLPLLTGLFGSSMLVLSIKNKIEIPEQRIKKPEVKLFKPLIGCLISSPLCSFLPGLGSGQAAIIGSQITQIPKKDKKSFLILLGATNTLVMGFSFISLYLISKTRTGAAFAIKEVLGIPTKQNLILIILIILFTGILSFYITIILAKIFSKKISKINYTKISIITLIILIIIVLIFSKISGIFVLIISTLLGIYTIKSNVRRTNMMGCLLIPTIIFYLMN